MTDMTIWEPKDFNFGDKLIITWTEGVEYAYWTGDYDMDSDEELIQSAIVLTFQGPTSVEADQIEKVPFQNIFIEKVASSVLA